MYQSNFSKLIDEIQNQINEDGDIRKSLTTHQKHNAAHRAKMSGTIRSLTKMSKSLKTTREQIISENRARMDNFNSSLRNAMLTKSLTSLEVIKLENQANRLSSALAERGLI